MKTRLRRVWERLGGGREGGAGGLLQLGSDVGEGGGEEISGPIVGSGSLSGLLVLLLLLELGLPVPLLLCRRLGNGGAGLRGTTAVSCFFSDWEKASSQNCKIFISELENLRLRTVSPTNFSRQLTRSSVLQIFIGPWFDIRYLIVDR